MSASRQIIPTGIVATLIIWSVGLSQSLRSQTNSAKFPIYSESFCLKIFEEAVEKARSGTWQISDRDRHILTQCRAKFPTTVDASIPLPKAAQCLDVVKTLVRDGTKKVREIELPEEQVKSLARCDEILKYYDLAADTMSPTLKLRERLAIDRTSYQTQLPQRGDIIAFNLPAASRSSDNSVPSTSRIIGLPGETVKIVAGKIYINDRQLQEDYITTSATPRTATAIVPADSYFVLGDNRTVADKSPKPSLPATVASEFVSRNAIVGKVIWHFGGS